MDRRRAATGCVASVAWVVLAIGSTAPAGSAEPLSFHLVLDPAFQRTAFSGRVYVILSEDRKRQPRLAINDWVHPPQLFARDVRGVQPGEIIVIGGGPLAYPEKLPDLGAREYHVQAVARRSLDHPVPGRGPGDLYSEARWQRLDPVHSGVMTFRLNRMVEPQPFRETDRVKLIEIESEALSRFHGRPVTIRAGVVLPAGWAEEPAARYPVLYLIPGFNGDHHMAFFVAQRLGALGLAASVLTVVPDPSCHFGHCVFADSENNGPWGWAFVHELVPAVEERFRGARSGAHRYVMGVSSGGWSALWLQMTYPDSFHGCWAHVPDPVDFRDFQRINLYEPGVNMFVDGQGRRRPIARQGDQVVLWYDDFVRRESVLGPGGQIHSFEAVFSHRGGNGRPELLFNRSTGAVNPKVARSWERYDIRLILERNWERLAPKLAGKLHIYAGGQDNFYLEGAVRRLKESLAKLGSDAEVKIIPSMGHGVDPHAVEPMYRIILDEFHAAPGAFTDPHADTGD